LAQALEVDVEVWCPDIVAPTRSISWPRQHIAAVAPKDIRTSNSLSRKVWIVSPWPRTTCRSSPSVQDRLSTRHDSEYSSPHRRNPERIRGIITRSEYGLSRSSWRLSSRPTTVEYCRGPVTMIKGTLERRRAARLLENVVTDHAGSIQSSSTMLRPAR